AWLITLFAVAMGWVHFRAEDFAAAGRMYATMFGIDGCSQPVRIQFLLGPWADALTAFCRTIVREQIVTLREWLTFLPLLVLAGGLAVMLPNIPEIFRLVERVRQHSARRRFVLEWRPSRAWAAAASLAFCLSVLLLGRPSVFLYFQF